MVASPAGQLLTWDLFPVSEPWDFHPHRLMNFLESRWDEICREAAASRRLGELHAARGDILAVFDQFIAVHKTYLELLDLQQRLTAHEFRSPRKRDEIARAFEQLIRLRDTIFAGWQSAEDLAAMLVKKFSLPAEKLRELAAKSPPPATWFEETADPFSAD